MTSGVTGHLQDRDMNDDRLRIALFMRFSAESLGEEAWLSQAITDVCCPFAARANPCLPPSNDVTTARKRGSRSPEKLGDSGFGVVRSGGVTRMTTSMRS